MDYQSAVDAFFAPRHPAPPPAVAAPTPARRLRDAAEVVAIHPVWSRGVNAALADLGLDFLSGYVWGRAAALGEPVPAVVATVFAWFEPGLVASAYEAGRAAAPRERLLATRDASTTESLRAVLGADGDGADVAEVAAVLRRAVEAVPADGRLLFAALRARPWPDHPVTALWRGCELAREFRGDGHVAAATLAGLTAVEANVLTELWLGMPLLSYTATRGWSPAAMDAAVTALRGRGLLDGAALTDAGRRARDELEAATDAAARPLVDALGGDLEAVAERLDAWAERCVAAATFPPDDCKRWAG